MRWRDGWTASYEWHEWFAWHPITIAGTTIWLETVSRRRRSKPWPFLPLTSPVFWEYRTLDGALTNEGRRKTQDDQRRAFSVVEPWKEPQP